MGRGDDILLLSGTVAGQQAHRSAEAEGHDQAQAALREPAEGETHWDALREALQRGTIRSPQVHDARIAALCRQHGVRELWSVDRDFSRMPDLRVRDPLVT